MLPPPLSPPCCQPCTVYRTSCSVNKENLIWGWGTVVELYGSLVLSVGFPHPLHLPLCPLLYFIGSGPCPVDCEVQLFGVGKWHRFYLIF